VIDDDPPRFGDGREERYSPLEGPKVSRELPEKQAATKKPNDTKGFNK
jgi:hypothetical protein